MFIAGLLVRSNPFDQYGPAQSDGYERALNAFMAKVNYLGKYLLIITTPPIVLCCSFTYFENNALRPAINPRGLNGTVLRADMGEMIAKSRRKLPKLNGLCPLFQHFYGCINRSFLHRE